MKRSNIYSIVAAVVLLAGIFTGCVPSMQQRIANTSVPEDYNGSLDTTNVADIEWRQFFTDPYLAALIDTALLNNQELNMTLQEMRVAQSEVKERKGEYLPSLNLGVGAEVEKVGRYTSQGANDATTDIEPGKEFPEPLGDFQLGLFANWELDIWKKLRNAKRSAAFRYLASVEGKNFMVTQLVAEIATSYYELLALDNQLEIVETNLAIQQNALKVVKLQKEAAKVTELAVRRFEAEVLKNQSLRYEIRQQIVETENRINFLVGRYPQPIERDATGFVNMVPDTVYAGLPAQLLANRPDIKQAELELEAAKLDIKVAKAAFFPSIGLTAGVGFQAFNPAYFLKTPESLIYNIAGDLMMPLLNRNAIKARYMAANAKQIQAAFNYERTILQAYVEVVNQLSKISNLQQSYSLKERQVEALSQSINISNSLFRSARADYMEVLLTQRDALEARMELIETKQQQMNALVHMYQALGGGWN